jgi:outer membrane protein assembly factor BamB
MLVGEDAVFVEAQGTAVRLDRRTLKRRWEVEIGNGRMSFLIADKLLCLWTVDSIAMRACEDGRLLWSGPPLGPRRWRDDMLLTYNTLRYEHRNVWTGEIVKTTEFRPAIQCGEAICGTKWIVLSEDGLFRGVAVDSGTVLWQRDLWTEMRTFARHVGPPAGETDSFGRSVEDVRVVAGSRPERFLAVSGAHTLGGSVEDGSIRWHVPASTGQSLPTAADGCVHFTGGGGHTVSVNEETGAVLWETRPSELRDAFREKVGTVYRDRIAFAYESGHLAVFNLEDGSLVSFYMAKSPLWCTGEADGRLLVTTDEADLLVFDESIWGL